MAGIKEVARKAGVSISTVSYALNGSNKISETTRARIKEVARSVGYTPKMAARTLKGNKTNIIGVYVSTFQGEFYGDLLDGIQHQLEELGYDMMVSSGVRTQKFLSEKLFDGAIVLDNKFTTQQLVKMLDSDNKIVVLDREIKHPNARTVLLNNKEGAIEAANYLIRMNLEKYYIVSGPIQNYDVSMRLAGAKEAFNNQKIDYEVLPGDFTAKSGFDAADRIFNKEKEKNVGIFALNDEEAIGVYRYLKTETPDLLHYCKLVGFDNNHSADFLQPALPSISYHKHTWGKVAAKTLVQLIEKVVDVENQSIQTHLSFRK